jgi:carbon storage regulator CsrA
MWTLGRERLGGWCWRVSGGSRAFDSHYSVWFVFQKQGGEGMLSLVRKDGEKVLVGDNVEITVRIEGNRARLVFDAPREVRILRTELIEKEKVAS